LFSSLPVQPSLPPPPSLRRVKSKLYFLINER
jgi:hypothetical protein